MISNFFEKQWTQHRPQNLSGLSHALFPTTFLKIAVNTNRSTSVTHANNQSLELHYKNTGPLAYSKSKRWSGSNSLSELRISVASKSVGFVFITLWTQFLSASLHLQSEERIESRNGLLYRKYKCFRGWFWPILYFLCETSVWHLDSCPPEDTWYGVILWVLRVLGQGLNQSARQPRSQSSSTISDVTSPVKLVGKIRLGHLALSRSVPSLLWSLG